MASDATGSNGSREAALERALAAHREAYKTKVGTIEADVAAGQLSAAQAREAMRTARGHLHP